MYWKYICVNYELQFNDYRTLWTQMLIPLDMCIRNRSKMSEMYSVVNTNICMIN